MNLNTDAILSEIAYLNKTHKVNVSHFQILQNNVAGALLGLSWSFPQYIEIWLGAS